MNILNQYGSGSDDDSVKANGTVKKAQSGVSKWLQEESDESDNENDIEEAVESKTTDSSSLLPASFLFQLDTSSESQFLNTAMQSSFKIPVLKPKLSNEEEKKDITKAVEPVVKKRSKEAELKALDDQINELKKSKLGSNHSVGGQKEKKAIGEKETAKDKVKRQRLAGQTGIDGGWKSEEHMRQRQMYD